MSRELRDVTISHVSMVKKGANQKKFFLYKADNDDENVELTAIIKSVDMPKRLVFGEVYIPFTKDAEEDWMSPEEISKMAHSFLKSYRNMDADHSFGEDVAIPVESYIAPCDIVLKSETGEVLVDDDGVEQVIKEGTWVMCAEVVDDVVLERIQKGEITGFSMAGFAKQVVESNTQLEKSEKPEQSEQVFKITKEEVFEYLKSEKVQKDFETEYNDVITNDIYLMLDVFWDAMLEAKWDATSVEEKKALMIKNCQQLIKLIGGIVKSEKERKDEIDEKIINLEKSIVAKNEDFILIEKELKDKSESFVALEKEFTSFKENARLPKATAIDNNEEKTSIKKAFEPVSIDVQNDSKLY